MRVIEVTKIREGAFGWFILSVAISNSHAKKETCKLCPVKGRICSGVNGSTLSVHKNRVNMLDQARCGVFGPYQHLMERRKPTNLNNCAQESPGSE